MTDRLTNTTETMNCTHPETDRIKAKMRVDGEWHNIWECPICGDTGSWVTS